MAKADLTPLAEIMRRLRDPENGCPWDIAQDFSTIAPYTIEEAYEVADAIDRNDMAALCDELGDALLQIIFHAQMADEAGHFDIDDVITGICNKMIRRHPHIFENGYEQQDGKMVRANWEDIKAKERAKSGYSATFSGVAKALPALMRAQKIQKRAVRTGFDWPDPSGAFAKLAEEVDEVKQANTNDEKFEEVGDMLFAAVNISRHYDIDAEHALRQATAKFENRFDIMEKLAGDGFNNLSLEEKEEYWQQAKSVE